MSVSLYVHIPFCMKRCIYCDFTSGIYDSEMAISYTNALKKELSNIPNSTPLSTLYIGGGTPTVLQTNLLADLLNHIFDHFDFNKTYEATIEANPGTLDKEKLKELLSSGLNRVSMGVQSFNDNELSFLSRLHTGKEAEEAFSIIRETGFQNAGIDLIYGLPGQDIKSWKKNLMKAVQLNPEHISTYELTVERGTGLFKLLQSVPDSSPLPPLVKGGINARPLEEDKIIEMYEYTIDYLTSHGFVHYEISNFAKPGYFSRHNLNYWDRGEYYGAGLGAHSFINGKRFSNTDNLATYIDLISDNKSPVISSEDITDQAAFSEAIFLGMRKTDGLIIESLSKRYHKNILTSYQKEIESLEKAGLVETTSSDCSYETSLRLTRKGLLLSNEVFTKFL